MEINSAVKKYFSKEELTDILTKYNLYYQIGLGNFVFETIQDIEETMKKLQELDLHLETQTALSNIFEIIVLYSEHEDFEEKVEKYIRIRALMHALKDFVNNDKELVCVDNYIKQKTEDITEDKFFTENMKLQFESEYPYIYDHYELFITDDMINKIQETLK